MTLSRPVQQFLVVAGMGLVAIVTVVVTISLMKSHKSDAARAIDVSSAPAVTAGAPAAVVGNVDGAPFGMALDDTDGYDGHPWNAPLGDMAKRGATVTPSFTQPNDKVGQPGLPTIIWVGVGLPANRQMGRAESFDPASFGAEFATVTRGSTQYIFAHDHFVMAVVSVPGTALFKLGQKLRDENQELPALHIEQTFDMSPPGSGIPPEALDSDCFRRGSTNTRIYLIEKWSTSILGEVRNDQGYVVYVPNVFYETLLDEAHHQKTPSGS